jgi:hypothetical protein
MQNCAGRRPAASQSIYSKFKKKRRELAVEALNKRVLRWLAGLNEVQLNPVLLGPEEHRLAGQFGPLSSTSFEVGIY